MKILENLALGPLTTLGIGGPARWFVEAVTEEEVLDSVAWAQKRMLPLFVLGGGSNLLVSDAGFAGLVLRVGIRGVEAFPEAGACRYRVGAGESWDAFVERTVMDGCAGIECLAGIPGTVGGTPVQNVGAYGQDVAETIESVRVLDLETLIFRDLAAAECSFGYRQSFFNTSAKGRFVVVRVDYRLSPGGAPDLGYADLQKLFSSDSKPGLTKVAAAVRRIRQAKGMLMVEGYTDYRSAGSFFKNPIISAEEFVRLTERLGAEVPHYPAGEGFVKLPAAWLIEQAGFAKGFAMGRAAISTRHTLALVNLGGATAVEVLALGDTIAAGVKARFGLVLQMEPIMVGF